MTYTQMGGTNLMFSKIMKNLKKSILSVTGAGLWGTFARDLSKQVITGYRVLDQRIPYQYYPRFSENQLIRIKYHSYWAHLHKEIGIVIRVASVPHTNSATLYFYEVLVGEQKITIVESYLDEVDDQE